MLLIKSDIKRIQTKLGISPVKFVYQTEEGHWMLRNKTFNGEKICFFLQRDGLCSIYDFRPEGCQFYPCIWDLDSHKVVSDDYCPHFDEFVCDENLNKSLELFILKLFGKL
ncbi:MAG: hypothetical protein EAX86_11225 [Candidatus Heimdallarchaeota archaeon]|nr:hypothetical protein [Candidatus Heimdallarchaeota archaeon]